MSAKGTPRGASSSARESPETPIATTCCEATEQEPSMDRPPTPAGTSSRSRRRMNRNRCLVVAAGGRQARWRSAREAVAALLVLAAVPGPVAAVSYYLATDVPAILGGTSFTQAQILRSDNGLYSIAVDTEGAMFKAIHRR